MISCKQCKSTGVQNPHTLYQAVLFISNKHSAPFGVQDCVHCVSRVKRSVLKRGTPLKMIFVLRDCQLIKLCLYDYECCTYGSLVLNFSLFSGQFNIHVITLYVKTD